MTVRHLVNQVADVTGNVFGSYIADAQEAARAATTSAKAYIASTKNIAEIATTRAAFNQDACIVAAEAQAAYAIGAAALAASRADHCPANDLRTANRAIIGTNYYAHFTTAAQTALAVAQTANIDQVRAMTKKVIASAFLALQLISLEVKAAAAAGIEDVDPADTQSFDVAKAIIAEATSALKTVAGTNNAFTPDYSSSDYIPDIENIAATINAATTIQDLDDAFKTMRAFYVRPISFSWSFFTYFNASARTAFYEILKAEYDKDFTAKDANFLGWTDRGSSSE